MKKKQLKTLLAEWLELCGDEPCWYDHHGYCQAHFLEDMNYCLVVRTMKAIR